jgi:hypothetical protein
LKVLDAQDIITPFHAMGSLAVAIWMITEEELSTRLFDSSKKERVTFVLAACRMERHARHTSHRDSWHDSKSLFCEVHLTHR